MRRPLCAFCLSALGVLVLCSFLPQMGLLLPSAAIFVVFCLLVWWRGGAARGYAVCLLLGAVLGVGIMEMTGARLAKIQDAYAVRDVTLTAEVESTGRAYTAGRVSAVLMVEKVDGETDGGAVIELGESLSEKFRIGTHQIGRASCRERV